MCVFAAPSAVCSFATAAVEAGIPSATDPAALRDDPNASAEATAFPPHIVIKPLVCDVPNVDAIVEKAPVPAKTDATSIKARNPSVVSIKFLSWYRVTCIFPLLFLITFS